jgi:hypothetical protein
VTSRLGTGKSLNFFYSVYSDLYVGEYLPEKQFDEEIGGPRGLPPIFMSDQLDIMAQLIQKNQILLKIVFIEYIRANSLVH